MASKISLAAGFLSSALSAPKCCYSNFGDASSCGGYPAGASSGLCNNDYSAKCNGDGDCTSLPVPTPVPLPVPVPVPIPVSGPTPPVPVPVPVPTPVPVPPVPTPPYSPEEMLKKVEEALRNANGDSVFQFQKPDGSWAVSDLYTWNDMIEGVKIMATDGIGDLKLMIGSGDNINYGLVNIAAFLAQCMAETIMYNACDENNWSNPDVTKMYGGTAYTSSYACGQGKQSYENYKCQKKDNDLAGGKMECDVDPDMQLRATTHAEWYGAPPAMFCAPKSVVPKAPKWNWGGPWCPPRGGYDFKEPFAANASLPSYFNYVNKGGHCRDYDPIKAGGWQFCGGEGCKSCEAPVFGREARTDVEGCCWWGRGVIQTTGVCNFGKLNFYLGKRGANEGRTVLYPDIDFCRNPGAICEVGAPPALKWIAGFFYWLNSVQSYVDDDGWVYLTALTDWVDAGMNIADTSLVDATSGIVNRGCYNPPCGGNVLDGQAKRAANFKTVMNALTLGTNSEAGIEWV